MHVSELQTPFLTRTGLAAVQYLPGVLHGEACQ